MDLLGLDNRSMEEKINVHEITRNQYAVEIKHFSTYFNNNFL